MDDEEVRDDEVFMSGEDMQECTRERHSFTRIDATSCSGTALSRQQPPGRNQFNTHGHARMECHTRRGVAPARLLLLGDYEDVRTCLG